MVSQRSQYQLPFFAEALYNSLSATARIDCTIITVQVPGDVQHQRGHRDHQHQQYARQGVHGRSLSQVDRWLISPEPSLLAIFEDLFLNS